jgi:acyl carrier protein
VNVSSRTPEGQPLRCEICGDVAAVEVADAGDAICPACGSLLWEFCSHHFAGALNVPPEELTIGTLDEWIFADSLDLVELAMGLEDRWGVVLDASDLESLRSVRDLIALIRRRQREQDQD